MRRTLVWLLGATLMLPVFLSGAARAASTAGLWHMDETSGTTAVDSSGNGNNGSLSNIAFVTPGFDGTGGAYSFNGTSSKVLVPDAPSLNPGSANITITLHVKFTVAPPPSVGDYDLVRKGTTNYYKIEIMASGQANCHFHGTVGGKGFTFGPNLADGNWHTITCTKTPTQISGTVDGISASKTVNIGSISSTVPLSLGGKSKGSQDLYNGVMDEVSIAVG